MKNMRWDHQQTWSIKKNIQMKIVWIVIEYLDTIPARIHRISVIATTVVPILQMLRIRTLEQIHTYMFLSTTTACTYYTCTNICHSYVVYLDIIWLWLAFATHTTNAKEIWKIMARSRSRLWIRLLIVIASHVRDCDWTTDCCCYCSRTDEPRMYVHKVKKQPWKFKSVLFPFKIQCELFEYF